jgi:hypothetical protein
MQNHPTTVSADPAAALYFVGFGLMCLNVKEGQYPPPPAYVGGQTGPFAAVKTWGAECHAHRHYWYLWLCTFIGSVGGGVGVFGLLFSLAIGLDVKQIGKERAYFYPCRSSPP